MRAVPEDGRRYPVKMRRIVVLPEPFGPSRPMISPAPTVKETWSTARRGPYHLVNCSATMTALIRQSCRGAAGTANAPAATGYIGSLRSVRLLELLWIVALGRLDAGPSRSWAVMKLAFSRPCSVRMYSYAFKMPVG